MCGVETRGETAALQGAQLGWCFWSCTDDIIEGVVQGCVVLMSPLMLGKVMEVSRSDWTICFIYSRQITYEYE